MTSPRRLPRLMTPAEYLAFEEKARVRHEYVAGRIYAMSGGTQRHARIINNVFAALQRAAGDGPCEVFGGNLLVRADEEIFYYPDVFVACRGLDDDDAVFLTSPCVAVEVLSPSTRSVDRRDKLTNYRRIPTLRAYLIVETTRHEVERHWRDAEGTWRSEIITPDSGGRVVVPCPEAVLTLDEIYRGVTVRPRLRRLKEPAPAAYTAAPAGA